jgi:hypothetical protein
MTISAPEETPTRRQILDENLKDLHESITYNSGAAFGRAMVELAIVSEYALGVTVDGLKSLFKRDTGSNIDPNS